MRKCNYHNYIDDYMDKIYSGEILASNDLILAMDMIQDRLNVPDVVIKSEMIDKAIELIEKYFEFKLLNWELFIIALIHCYYESTDMVVFDEIVIVMGRGNGKNGFISGLTWYLTTHYHGVKGYNVDIIANNEEQAKTSFEDIFQVLETHWKKLKKFFYKSKEKILNLKTKSYIKFNTSNAKTKDGKRSACLVFDEIHEYLTYDSIKVFTSGFGKRKHSRTFYITTNGYVRGGILDEMLELGRRILKGEIKDLNTLYLIYCIENKEEANDPKNWIKANPSLPYLPELQKELNKDAVKMKYQPHKAIEFLTKRMNFPVEEPYAVVATWDKIMATNKPIPYDDLLGATCIGAVDYAQISDFASCGLLFKKNGKRIFIEHSFVCKKALSDESRKIKFPVQEMSDRGLITIVNEETIKGEYIAKWFLDHSATYNILNIYADDYRKSILVEAFTASGLPLTSVRSGPITHGKVAPLIETLFYDELLTLGDNPTMRWYINNTYQQLDGKGNVTYLKIEPKTRKTDGFFAFIHALSKDDELVEEVGFMDLDVITS